jgi:hypothetical protein
MKKPPRSSEQIEYEMASMLSSTDESKSDHLNYKMPYHVMGYVIFEMSDTRTV